LQLNFSKLLHKKTQVAKSNLGFIFSELEHG